MAEATNKRKGGGDGDRRSNKRQKKGKKYHKFSASGITPGTSGVFVTCQRGHEFQCVGELYSLFDEFRQRLWPDDDLPSDEEKGADADDIEASIQSELSTLKSKSKEKPFYSVKMPQECVTFMLTRPPINPVRLVHEICLDTLAGNKRTRWAQRFTPIQSTCHANLVDFRSLCETILNPIFHCENVVPLKYAIRPNARDNTSMGRDSVIQVVGSVIGREHPVDLKNYDVMILVETVKNITGMSVVTDFDKLRRFNVEQLYNQYQSIQEKTSKGEVKVEPTNLEGKAETAMALSQDDVGVVDDGDDKEFKIKLEE